MRLNSYISETGVCSRREADRWIEEGRVSVNGRRAELGTQVQAGDEVQVDGKIIGPRQQRHVYIALNKPVGIVCTTDRAEPDNITDHVNHPLRIFPIGRLDKDSEGLILLTSDGDIVNDLLRVENRHEKEYLVTVDQPVTDAFVRGMQAGVHLPELEQTTRRCDVERTGPNSFRIVLTQGLNRQIRRMCKVFGYEVRRLQRVRFVNIRLDTLRPGQWRDLEPAELQELLRDRTPSASPAPRDSGQPTANTGAVTGAPPAARAPADRPREPHLPAPSTGATSRPSSGTSFASLPLQAELLQALDSLAYHEMTPIQALSLPPMLAGRDVIGQARTGTGKTAAFGLALLSRIDPALKGVQGLVLCPTRELADQIAKEMRRLARCLPNVKLTTLSGGIDTRPQVASLKHPPHIVVGMAGRVQELVDEGHLQLDGVRMLVLDEADRMLGADFEQATRALVARTPHGRQTLLFSATMPAEVRVAAQDLLNDPVEATADAVGALPGITQTFYRVTPERRLDALAHLLSAETPESALVFCHTRDDVLEVEAALGARGFSVLGLHGHTDQRAREEILVRFANGSCRVLVATDIASRGLDVENLAAVISYELPREPQAHLHRIGRTGRAGRSGQAWHLVTSLERDRLQAIGALLSTTPAEQTLPSKLAPDRPLQPKVVTLCVDGGRADKLRPGDLLGALTGEAGLSKDAIGKISTFNTRTYVAVDRKVAAQAQQRLSAGLIKGRRFRVRLID